MLYVLPPPRAPNPPSPWDSILCPEGGDSSGSDRRTWVNNHSRRPPRIRLRSLQIVKKDDSLNGGQDETDTGRNSKSLSECYFAGKGTALVLPAEAQKSSRKTGAQENNIQKHLQSMFYLLRPEETLKMAVKLESVHPSRTRYLVVVSRMGKRAEESCLLGIDCNEKTTVGLVLRVLADTSITLDGDGGFSVSVCGRHHIFKPVSVQAMWSALQTLHKVSHKARSENYFQGGGSHGWVSYYEDRIESDRSCLNEWHAMDNLESKRPPSPDSVRTKPRERDETERVIRATLKEIMMSVDLDEVTSKYIRSRLEEDLDMDLGEYKSFIDQEMLIILGQMDAPTEIFDHVYLGSEWNASNYEELQRNGVGHILNVTREIDNFFPGTFDYLNIRVYDDEKTDLLKHWDDTFKYISKARREGSKVLVHCKMGVSRSASVVIAYAMKAYNWDFKKALQHVKEKRSCIKPNTSFLSQLETYQGILDAMKNKEKLQRSKSETNLKSPALTAKTEKILKEGDLTLANKGSSLNPNSLQTTMSGQDLRQLGARPKSWSPDNVVSSNLTEEPKTPPVFLSLENLNKKEIVQKAVKECSMVRENVLLPCDNGESYSVSPNRIVHLPGQTHEQNASVKERVNELEAQQENKMEKKKLVLNLTSQFETTSQNSKPPSPKDVEEASKMETWDPGEQQPNKTSYCNGTTDICDLENSVSDNSDSAVCSKVPEQCYTARTKTVSVCVRDGDPFSNQLDRVFDKEERKQQRLSTVPVETTEEVFRECPSRQNSWSSYDSAVVLGYQGETRDAPSRHSSWGSGDTRTLPSRNSSFGSYDMRVGAPIHCLNEKGEKVVHPDVFENSSSGIFQCDDLPWYTGTVKRTKQKLEESNSNKKADTLLLHSDCPNTILSRSETSVEAFNTALIHCKQPENMLIPPSRNLNVSSEDLGMPRLSASAPESSSMELVSQECSLSRSASNVSTIANLHKDCTSSVISTPQCASVKQHKLYLENLSKDIVNNPTKKSEDVEDAGTTGIVQNLKKEFEAKTERLSESTSDIVKSTTRVNSLPTSPISIHQPKEEKPPTSPVMSDPGEDLNFKKLRGKFESQEKSKQDTQVTLRPKPFAQNKNTRHSCFEVSADKSPRRATPLSNFNRNCINADKEDDFKRPPIPPLNRATPNVVVATVKAIAAKKQQQFGKSHPLARLNIKPRHNSPLYNTM